MIDMFDENRIFPINHVTVECYKSDGYCEVNTIVLATPNSQTQQYHVMDIGENVYKITRWENGNIDGVIVGRPDACRTSSISYNFKAKEFFETTRNTKHECIIAESKLPKPSITQIVEGGKIIREEFAKIQQRAYSYLSSAFRRQVDELKNRYSVKVKKPGR